MADFNKFIHPTNGCYYAFVEVPVAMLQITAPPDSHPLGAVTEWDEELQDYVTRQKTMLEFMLPPIFSIDGTKCIASFAAMNAPSYREIGTTEADMEQWLAFVTPHGLTIDTWLTITERDLLLAGADYNYES